MIIWDLVTKEQDENERQDDQDDIPNLIENFFLIEISLLPSKDSSLYLSRLPKWV